MASEIAKQAADDPPQHKILLVPADPKYSPTEDVLWPADRWCGPMATDGAGATDGGMTDGADDRGTDGARHD